MNMSIASAAATSPVRMLLLAWLRSIEVKSNQAAMTLSAAIAANSRNRYASEPR